MQTLSALVLGPIEEYLDHVSKRYCLVLSPQRLIRVEELFERERAIFPSYTIGAEITSQEEFDPAAARVTILHTQQNSFGSSLSNSATHRMTILSYGQNSVDCCNNRDYCTAATRLGLEDEATIEETGGIIFQEYNYTGVMWLESSLSPVWNKEFRLFKSRATLAIKLGGGDG